MFRGEVFHNVEAINHVEYKIHEPAGYQYLPGLD